MKHWIKPLMWVAAVFLQIIMTQAVTFAASFALPNNEHIRSEQPVLFAVFVSLTFAAGVFLGGWLAIRMGWINLPPRLPLRAIGALLGAALPLMVGLLVPAVLQAEGAWPSLLLSLALFYLAGILAR